MLCPNCGRDCGDKLQLCNDCEAARAALAPPTAPRGGESFEPPPLTPLADASNFDYAGFWLRVCSTLVDSAILAVLSFVVTAILTAVLNVSVGPLLRWLTPEIHSTNFLMMVLVGYLGAAIATLILFGIAGSLYFVLFECSSFQATPGKIVTGTIVTDLHGERVSFPQATARYLAKPCSALIFGWGFLMPIFTERRQTLHDKMTGCVVRKRVERPIFQHFAAALASFAILWFIPSDAEKMKKYSSRKTTTIVLDGRKDFGDTNPPARPFANLKPRAPIRYEPAPTQAPTPVPEPTPVPTPEVLGSFSGPHARVRSPMGGFDAKGVVAFYYPDNHSVAIGFYPQEITSSELDILKRRGVLSKANASNRPLMTLNLDFDSSGSVSEDSLVSYTANFYQDAMHSFTFASGNDAVSFGKNRARLAVEDVWKISGTLTPGGKLSITTRGRVNGTSNASLNFRWDIAEEVVVFGRN